MAGVNENTEYIEEVYQLETEDPVLGGPDGISNLQAKALASRTKWLRAIIAEICASQSIVLNNAQTGQLLTALDARYFKNENLPAQATDAELLAAIQAHNNAGDPHPQYLTEPEVLALIANIDLSARFTTTANINLNGLAVQAGGDWGVALTEGDVILVKNQAVPQNNGWYVSAAGAWTRVNYLDQSAEIKAGMLTKVTEGATLADTVWMLTTDAPIVLNTSALNFARKDATFGLTTQIVTASFSTRTVVSCAANAWTDTGLTVTITPKTTNEKIKINWRVGYAGSDSNVPVRARLVRGSATVISDGSCVNAGMPLNGEATVTGDILTAIDTPAAITPVTYKIQIRSVTAQSVAVNGGFSDSATINTTSYAILEGVNLP